MIYICIYILYSNTNNDDNYTNPPPRLLLEKEVRMKKSLLKYPVEKFELIINLMAQPQNNFDDWFPLLPKLANAPINDSKLPNLQNAVASEIEKNIHSICTKLTHGFIFRLEKQLMLQMPFAITKIITKYSFEDAYFFEEWPDPAPTSKKWTPTITIVWKTN